MEIVGQNTADNQWRPECALSCYRASKTMEDLSGDEYSILDELHSKLTRDKSEEETQRIMAFWQKLDDYRTRSLQRSGDGNMTGSQMIKQFKWDVLWWDLSYDDQKSKQCRSNLTKLFHHKSAWKHAAAAIMDDGLPKLQQPHRRNDATANINALGKFARALAKWLKTFASHMHAYRETSEYQKHVQDSNAAMKKGK